MSNIGLRLFQQLKAIDPDVSRDDYFDEEQHSWDVEGLEEDLKVAEDRLQQTGSTSIHNNTTQIQPLLPSLTTNTNISNINNNYNIQSLPPINTIPSTTNTINISNTTIAMPSNVSINTNPMNHISNGNMDEDIDIRNTMDTNPAQMPSPNASPSIEYDPNDKDDDMIMDTHTHIHTHNMSVVNNNANININEMQPIIRKRKNDNDILPIIKKQKLNNENNKWNDLALKKLFSLKRQVKNSGWFWEPVDEIKHSAPNYYLVCPLPSDYGTICNKLEKRQYNTLDEFLRDCELVFINARLYNTSVHAVHKASLNLEKKFKELMNTFVVQHSKEYGSQKTLYYWQNAKKNYKPFAVPIDEQ
eukprot:459207_1